MRNTSYYIINGITFYRVFASAILLTLILTRQVEIFKWVLGFSFFTDAIDGFLARKYKVVSKLGSRLDSIGDDLTVLMGVVGIFVFKPGFMQQHAVIVFIVIMLTLLVIQMTLALYRYRRLSSFHTYLAKIAALFQGGFLILIFFLPQWPMPLFYAAAIITILDLVEEIILVLMIPDWRTDVKGWFWVRRELSKKRSRVA